MICLNLVQSLSGRVKKNLPRRQCFWNYLGIHLWGRMFPDVTEALSYPSFLPCQIQCCPAGDGSGHISTPSYRDLGAAQPGLVHDQLEVKITEVGRPFSFSNWAWAPQGRKLYVVHYCWAAQLESFNQLVVEWN